MASQAEDPRRRVLGRWAAVATLWLTACASLPPPKNADDLCAVFAERASWYQAARRAEQRWGTALWLQMAVMRHESSYVQDAAPPRGSVLGLPWRSRPSTAYGYAQATDGTWQWYIDQTGNRGADREEFADAADFIAWYLAQSRQILGLAADDAYNHYLAYHEGHAGYRSGSYRGKGWLKRYARRVEQTAARYARQLSRCHPPAAGF